MIDFIKNFIKTANEYPDRPAVIDHDGTRITTYSELLAATLRVNAWLRNHGLGREDISAIYFPKSMEYIATRIGIMMSGGAWVGLEDLMGKERIDFVIQDSKCKVVFDEKIWSEVVALSPCEDIADSDSHDLAYIIYTSGSTGTPKGVAQEYGVYENISMGTYGFSGDYCSPEPMQFAEVAPQTFVSGVYTTIGVLDVRGTIHEISMEMVRNIDALTTYFIENGIHHSFMTPTFIKLLLKDSRIQLRAVGTGGEIVSDVYTDRFDIYNVYGPSEFGFPTCLFKLDRAYDNTPIGFPVCKSDIILLDEKGQPSDEGTFCIHLPYFRGYVGDTDRSCFVTIEGKEYFRTSDYVLRDEDGFYTVLDRLDDMVKINGNRVDTREVETAVKKLSGVEFCCVKSYQNNGIKALCAYYTGSSEIDSIAAADTLRGLVPEYMIPSCYIKLTEIPLNDNGKLDKGNLPRPQGIFRTMPYAAPENDLQEKICLVLKTVLKSADNIGIDDDFFMMGGDSILAMEALANCDIPGLSVQMVYEGRTARKIALLLSSFTNTSKDIQGQPTRALLNAMQRYLLKKDLSIPNTCMFNIPFRFNIMPDADLERLSEAISTSVRAHPALLSIIEEKDGEYFQCYDPNTIPSYPVENMSDEELEKVAASFVRPFELNGGPLFRCRVIRGESKSCVLMDAYHIICDGFSLEKFVADVKLAFTGEDIPKDFCYQILEEEADYRLSFGFKRDMDYFDNLYNHHGWSICPKPDRDSNENADEKIFLPFSFDKGKAEGLEKVYGFGKGGLYAVATALAIATYNDCENVMLSWTWHGRSDGRRMNSVGVFFRDIPIALKLKRGLLLTELYDEVISQIRGGITHGSLSYWCEKGSYEGADLVCLLYQGEIYEYHDGEGVVSDMEYLPIPDFACNNNAFDVEILDGTDSFGVLLDYNASRYDKKSMERFGKLIDKICEEIIILNPNTTTVGQLIQRVENS